MAKSPGRHGALYLELLKQFQEVPRGSREWYALLDAMTKIETSRNQKKAPAKTEAGKTAKKAKPAKSIPASSDTARFLADLNRHNVNEPKPPETP